MSKQSLIQLFQQTYHEDVEQITRLPFSGSGRVYYRIKSATKNVLGAFNNELKENEAFFSFTQVFREQGIPVPEIYAIAENREAYLLQDLGNQTVVDYFSKGSKEDPTFDSLSVLKGILKDLISIQVKAGSSVDYSKCTPREVFDAQAIRWDLNYFKYEFLKLADVGFDEQKLEDDFDTLTLELTATAENFFMYRDFQLRNMMWYEGKVWYIDYQGGRKGPLQYDLASILLSPTTGLSESQRSVLLDFYMDELGKTMPVDRTKFVFQFQAIALVRRLQAMGAYGYRGLYQRKPGFRSGIHTAIWDISNLLELSSGNLLLPELERIFSTLLKSKWMESYVLPKGKLTINIISFSYKKGIPDDPSENGGGFVIDCRGIPNPGRYPEYRSQSGLDEEVIQYLEQFDEVHQFAGSIKQLVSIPIENYIERGFDHLCIYFGCTGGQHRSVYNAECTARWIRETYPVNVQLVHREKENW